MYSMGIARRSDLYPVTAHPTIKTCDEVPRAARLGGIFLQTQLEALRICFAAKQQHAEGV